MMQQLKEIFGRGYDMSYRWFRIKELLGAIALIVFMVFAGIMKFGIEFGSLIWMYFLLSKFWYTLFVISWFVWQVGSFWMMKKCKKNSKGKALTKPRKTRVETLRLAGLRVNDKVEIIKGDFINKKGVITRLWEDYETFTGLDYSIAEVLLEGESVSRQFYPDLVERIY